MSAQGWLLQAVQAQQTAEVCSQAAACDSMYDQCCPCPLTCACVAHAAMQAQ